MAGLLNAMPSEKSKNVIFDFSELDKIPIVEATLKLYRRYKQNISGIAKWNPGYDVHGGENPLYPPANQNIRMGFIDYAISMKMFVFFLTAGCIPKTKHNEAMEEIASFKGKHLLEVHGYDDTVSIAGNLFEAETTCTKSRNLGQIPGSSATNMALFSSIQVPIFNPFLQISTINYEQNKKIC